jgi:hypothetical protein
MTPDDYVQAARVPESLKPQTFGPWTIRRWKRSDFDTRKLSLVGQFELQEALQRIGFDNYTLLCRVSWRTLHLKDESEVVMEDSKEELRKHLPIWLNARGRVLVTGLGLGCVVRGLLAKPEVEHITVVEIDKSILRIVGHEFRFNRRVTLVHCDAFNFQPSGQFDYGWHDLWTDGEEHLQLQHVRLLKKFHDTCERQGAWQLPRFIRKKIKRYYPLVDE